MAPNTIDTLFFEMVWGQGTGPGGRLLDRIEKLDANGLGC
ncbi:hypothetical protein LV82_01456 [Albidovulum inexpectatum]|uniref:Uncharacterized protein n=1 Tax=Albidovulum inexpectatum TaxID=196587 RepID=A0A2S5JGU5_9RHOB|nr:hypothetical protein LV82_01456 [Albidovulum inexpectatum]